MSATGPGQSLDLMFDVVAVLHAAQLDYAVIGALAASVHGVVRASQDADAVVSATSAQLGDVEKRLATMGLKTELRRGGFDDPIPAVLLITDQFGNRVDLLGGIRGLDGAVYQRAIEVAIAGVSERLRVVGVEDLIAMKCFADGPKDLLDARRCIAVAGTTLDLALLKRLVVGYGRVAMANCEKLLAEVKK